jgi:hypothetical protein
MESCVSRPSYPASKIGEGDLTWEPVEIVAALIKINLSRKTEKPTNAKL